MPCEWTLPDSRWRSAATAVNWSSTTDRRQRALPLPCNCNPSNVALKTTNPIRVQTSGASHQVASVVTVLGPPGAARELAHGPHINYTVIVLTRPRMIPTLCNEAFDPCAPRGRADVLCVRQVSILQPQTLVRILGASAALHPDTFKCGQTEWDFSFGLSVSSLPLTRAIDAHTRYTPKPPTHIFSAVRGWGLTAGEGRGRKAGEWSGFQSCRPLFESVAISTSDPVPFRIQASQDLPGALPKPRQRDDLEGIPCGLGDVYSSKRPQPSAIKQKYIRVSAYQLRARVSKCYGAVPSKTLGKHDNSIAISG